MKCPQCGYEWQPRTKQPKKCPNPKCQHWFIKLPTPKLAMLFIALALMTTGCHKKIMDITTGPQQPIASGLYVVMGQSNANRMFENASATLMNTLQSKAIHEVYGLNCAVNGSPISSWMPGQKNYQNCLTQINQTGKPIAGIIWWQGEAEAEGMDGIEPANNWTQSFTTLMTHFRSDLNNPSIPVLYTRLSNRNAGLPYLDKMIGAQNEVHIQNAMLITVDDIPVLDGLHYSPDNYTLLARRFANSF